MARHFGLRERDVPFNGPGFMQTAFGIICCFLLVFIAIALALFLSVKAGFARDLGQWQNTDPEIKHWYQSLMQPDTFPPLSCCSIADAYWADEYYVENGKLIVVVTDDRDDVPLMRAHVPNGTKYIVPDKKLIGAKKEGNPTGHSVIFLGTIQWPQAESYSSEEAQAHRAVLCFAFGTGG
jgi:hypothetical protein